MIKNKTKQKKNNDGVFFEVLRVLRCIISYAIPPYWSMAPARWRTSGISFGSSALSAACSHVTLIRHDYEHVIHACACLLKMARPGWGGPQTIAENITSGPRNYSLFQLLQTKPQLVCVHSGIVALKGLLRQFFSPCSDNQFSNGVDSPVTGRVVDFGQKPTNNFE